MTEVTALGELLIDFVQNGSGPQGNPQFEANPGGAPANVLAMLSKLGHRCAFLGKVGQDAFGDQLEQTLLRLGIDTEGLRRDPEVPTTLALVHTLLNGDREFSFYRKPGADLMLRPEELAEEKICACLSGKAKRRPAGGCAGDWKKRISSRSRITKSAS